MPSVSRLGDLSAGHGTFSPTACISTPVTKTYFNGLLAQSLGSIYLPHSSGRITHTNSIRNTITGSNKVYIEGNKAIRTGDNIQCGDTAGPGSHNVLIGG